jgi:hypothetical protein
MGRPNVTVTPLTLEFEGANKSHTATSSASMSRLCRRSEDELHNISTVIDDSDALDMSSHDTGSLRMRRSA